MQTKLNLESRWTPSNLLTYIKSSKGKFGKTAGIFNILAKQKEEAIQGSEVSPDLQGGGHEVDGALSSPLRENKIPRMHQPAKEIGDWNRKIGKRLERIMK